MSSQTNGSRSLRETGPRSLPKDDAYHLLQNGRRRAVLRYLFAREGETFWLRDIADEVAAWEYDTTVERLTPEQRQRVYIGLYQSHLPKLDEYDVIDYEPSVGRVTLRPLSSVLEPLVGDGLAVEQSIRVGESDTDAGQSGGFLDHLLSR